MDNESPELVPFVLGFILTFLSFVALWLNIRPMDA